MKADSFEPPGRSGELRGCGRMVWVDDEATEEGGGERMKPPGGGAAIATRYVEVRKTRNA